MARLPRKFRLNEIDQAGFLGDVGDVLVLVERVQVDAVDAAGAVFVDLVDGVFDTGLPEALLLARDVGVERLFVEGVRDCLLYTSDAADD